MELRCSHPKAKVIWVDPYDKIKLTGEHDDAE